jgi:hypothetical protein
MVLSQVMLFPFLRDTIIKKQPVAGAKVPFNFCLLV